MAVFYTGDACRADMVDMAELDTTSLGGWQNSHSGSCSVPSIVGGYSVQPDLLPGWSPRSLRYFFASLQFNSNWPCHVGLRARPEVCLGGYNGAEQDVPEEISDLLPCAGSGR